jgi:Family of unknown function (DUF5719)
VSDPYDPREGPEQPPEPVIPSRAARHQAKRGRFRRGRPARPGPDRPARPSPEPPPPTPPARSTGTHPSEGPRTPPGGPPDPPGPWAPTDREPPRPAPADWATERPSGDLGQEVWEPPAAAPPDGDGAGPAAEPAALLVGRAREQRGPRRRRVPLRPPSVAAPPLRGVAASSVGLAGVLVAAATALVVAVGALPSASPPTTPATRGPYSARWVCPLLAGQPTTVTVANVGSATAQVQTAVRASKQPAPPASKKLAAGVTQRLALQPKEDGYVQVEAFSAPVAVSADGLGCAPGPSNRWWLPASDTRQGIDTTVVVANPNNDPAVVDLVPHVTAGSLPADKELFVPPRSAVTRQLGDVATTGLKASIEVIARAGRVVAGAAVRSTGAGQPALLPAQGALRPAWWFAGGLSGGGRQSQLLVTNPNPTRLQLTVEIATSKGTFKPPGPFEEPIANGGTAELAIPPLDVRGPFAVKVRSRDGAAFAAALRVTEGEDAGTVSRIDLGTGQPERGWLLPKPPQGGQLVLANLSAKKLEARIGGIGADDGRGGQPIQVPPGRVLVQKVPAGVENLLVEAGATGLVAAPVGGGQVVPGSAVGGIPAGGPVVTGPAAAP